MIGGRMITAVMWEASQPGRWWSTRQHDPFNLYARRARRSWHQWWVSAIVSQIGKRQRCL